MSLPLKDLTKVNQIIARIHCGKFDANDVDNLLMKLRPYSKGNEIFLEIAHFVAHPDARDRGLAQRAINNFFYFIKYIEEYDFAGRRLNLDEPFPNYLYHVFISQAKLFDDAELMSVCKMGRASLIRKIESNFTIDKKTGLCGAKKKIGAQLLSAIGFIMRDIIVKSAFNLEDFQIELRKVLRLNNINFDEDIWVRQGENINLAILCLVSNTNFIVGDDIVVNCELGSEMSNRIISGKTISPNGGITEGSGSFGRLIVRSKVQIKVEGKGPVWFSFPIIDSQLDAEKYCDPSLIVRESTSGKFGDCIAEVINFVPDMSMSSDFKLVRTESINH